MFISPKFCLKQVTVDGIKVILNSEEAKDLKKKYPQAVIHNLRKGRSKPSLHGPVTVTKY